ncbi:MAG: hypothetical protein KDB61_15815, partial [Planctomycetes bacterium]|nr:hypothetical protein [Planctomycetota bacterium]
LWLLLGTHGGQRAFDSLVTEWNHLPVDERGPVALAMARAGRLDQVEAWSKEAPGDEWLAKALSGETGQALWRAFE